MVSYPAIDSGSAYIEELHSEQHHAHEEYVITLMQAGFVTFEGEQRVSIKPGMLTLVPSGMPHALLKGSGMQVHWLSFTGTSVQLQESDPLMSPFALIRQGALPIFKLDSGRIAYVVTLFEEIQSELQGEANQKILASLVCLLLNEVKKASTLSKLDLGAETKVGKALGYIQANSCRGISLKDVAANLHMSPAYLASKVKNSTGYSVGQWIIKYRLKQAQGLLANTDKKVEQIGLEIGWQDTTHFIRQFKKTYRQTPAAWRRAQRSGMPNSTN